MVAKAKTGTGKTLSFMIPAVDAAAKSVGQRGGKRISGLVLSPTRELAQQTLEEGKILARYHGLSLACIVGGTNAKKDMSTLGLSGGRAPDILVATPGRLNDHLENSRGFADAILARLEVLVFDEADQLLDMGFRPAIEKMLRCLTASKQTRQTLLFSATLPADVASIAKLAMRDASKYAFIDTVGDAEEQTHQHVPQKAVLCRDKRTGSSELVARVAEAIEEDVSEHKVIVFFTTARLTQFYSELLIDVQTQSNNGSSAALAALSKTKIFEIHSRKSQSHRTKVAEQFRDSRGGCCLFTSDVSARGMDYPDVTRVIQFGAPARHQRLNSQVYTIEQFYVRRLWERG